MKIIHLISELKKTTKILKQQNKTIGFVPTMGALHQGHTSLIKNARNSNDIVVVSIFVNPTQFLVNEDLDNYPKKDQADIKICELCGVDFLFIPNIKTIYKDDEVLLKAPKTKGFILEGENRPGHFDGMLQIVLKLFNLTSPTNAYFGKKDAQQLSLINQMVRNFYLDINIVECEIERENDGLALSSRNVYLSDIERKKALLISKSLKKAAKLVGSNEKLSKNIKDEIKNILLQDKDIKIQYISIVNKNFEQIEIIELKNTIILIAVKIGTTRLIDNIWI